MLVILLAQAVITAPPIGAVRDSAGRIAAVRGLPGNFVVSAPEPEAVIAYAHSGFSSIAKFDTEWRTSTRRGPAPPGAALFAFDRAGRPALIYFESTASLLHLDSGVETALPGKIESIAVGDGGSVRAIAVRDGARYEIRGTFEFPLDNVTGPAFLNALGDLVFLSGTSVVIRHPNGIEVRLELPAAVESIEQMGDGLVHLRPGLALRYESGREKLFHLPGSAE